MEKQQKIALLCDYGLDDAVATAYLLQYADRFDLIDILPIGGNFPERDSFINAKRVLDAVVRERGAGFDNVRIVDTSGVLQPEERLTDIHGNDGMGDVLPDDFEETVEVIKYAAWLEKVDEAYTVVSLGPCTVTLDILRKKGALPLCIMGGNIDEPPNYNGYEFNHGMDTAAFAECVRFPHVAATLDTCHAKQCDINGMVFDSSTVLGRLLEGYRKLSNERKETECFVYDLTVVVWLMHPERFSTEAKVDRDNNTVTVLKYIGTEPII